jgi:cytidine deaminase
MTVLEELIDAALSVCEKSRATASQQQSHNHARSAVLLSVSGKTYTGCDVHIASNSANAEAHGVSAERAALLAAVADGSNKFDVRLVIFLLLC